MCSYEIQVEGARIKPLRTSIDVDGLLRDEQLIVNVCVERTDITRCVVVVTMDGVPVSDTTVKVSRGAIADGYEVIAYKD